MTKLEEVKNKVEIGKSKLVPGLVKEALEEGNSPEAVLGAMIDVMGIVGDKFATGAIYVPEMLIAAKAMKKGVDVLKPKMAGEDSTSLGKCIIGTVAGDLHDIGKNLVSLMIGSAGFEMVDLGVDVPVERFIEAIKETEGVKLVALSALLTTTMPSLKETVEAIKSSGLEGFKIIVGGAPVTEEFAEAIGADAFAPDAGTAASEVKKLAGVA